ncbi:MAG TPA: hypothetical protein PLR93_00150 [Anaerolineales bacterium]|nr:hypothetical protein [Anaerolineales bacterium]HNH25394.1 hypothetical protein [Anaerolineales bacterium]
MWLVGYMRHDDKKPLLHVLGLAFASVGCCAPVSDDYKSGRTNVFSRFLDLWLIHRWLGAWHVWVNALVCYGYQKETTTDRRLAANGIKNASPFTARHFYKKYLCFGFIDGAEAVDEVDSQP